MKIPKNILQKAQEYWAVVASSGMAYEIRTETLCQGSFVDGFFCRAESRTTTTKDQEMTPNQAARKVFDAALFCPTDAEGLRPFLAGWMHLFRSLQAGFPEDDVKRLLVLEIVGQKRPFILKKLVGHLGTLQRKKLYASIRKVSHVRL